MTPDRARAVRPIDFTRAPSHEKGRARQQFAIADTSPGAGAILEAMALQRMDNVGIVVEDLAGAIAFFRELGLELEGQMTVEGHWVDQVVGLEGVRSDIAMMRTPNGHGRLELARYQRPAAVSAGPRPAPANTLGLHRVMFAVDDIDDVLARLQARGAQLIGEVAQYENAYRLCYLRGPEGIILALAQQIG
jgi:catechol 2,3-dioxygenase-like lactoylglutathione lyase family enzyme